MTLNSRPVRPGDHVFLVDGSSFVFRAYFQSIRQDQKYNYRSDRLPTGAVRIFATKLLQFVREGATGIKPTHLAIIFDKSENSFRKALYPLYKANRSDPPEDLVPQFPLMREAVRRRAAPSLEALQALPRLELGLKLLDVFVRYPRPPRAWIPFNYCALTRRFPASRALARATDWLCPLS